MAKVVTLNPISPITFEYQDYSTQDDTLIVNFTVEPTFNPLQNYVTYFIYDLNNDIVFSNEIDFRGYSIIDGQVVLNPEADVETAGFEEGGYNVVYNFLNNELSSSYSQRLYIDQISPDRTELRLNTTQIPNFDLINGANSLITQIQNSVGVYFDFFLDFGNNQLIIANNMLLDTSNPEDPTVLVKLYEPLPINFVVKDECWIVTEVADTVAYNVNITQTFELLDESIYLKGPNLNLSIKDQINNSTDYVNYSNLSSNTSYDAGTSSSLNYQINSILAERGVEINVDYSDYNNFIYFSSALTRLENFYYKLQLIEQYTYSSSLSNNSPSSYSVTSSNIWQAKINEIITTFDGYDYFLYYESGSGAWPKINSTYPYTNVLTTSSSGSAFIISQSIIATNFDENNNNALINSIPQYLRDDSQNAEYELFVEMLGEMFDNIWIYYQDVTNKWNADNRLNYGVSKDLVAEVLRDLGLKIYQNNFSSNDLYLAFLGVAPDGNTFPFPNITGSYPVPSGYEYINTKVSASNTVVPLQDVEYSFYKRLYHNLPLLLKKKGTTTGLQDLITTYGIPSTILRVAEFGGKDKDESNDWDYYKQRYNYKYETSASGFISSSWVLNSNWSQTTPASVQFRFKLPSSGSTGAVDNAIDFPSQSLWQLDSDVKLVLEYTGSGFTSGSYSGSIVNPYYQYGTLKFLPDAVNTPNQSASIYLPFFNGEWWSVMVTLNNSTASLSAGDNIYNGDDGSQLGFYATSSINGVDDTEWNNGLYSYFATGSTGYTAFSGSLQEVRYYVIVLEENDFKDFIMNPDSIESNGLNNTPNQLAFRASLGGELYTGSASIHPKVTGSWIATSSFASNSNFYTGSGIFNPNIETVYLDQPAAGIKNIVSNKIQIVDTIIASGNTTNTNNLGTNVLSQYRSIQQKGSGSYTENLAYTEIAFSPQNEINDDIMDQLGFFNMGDYIGDPRQRFNQDTSYPDLDALRNAYFEKYKSNYNIFEYINLIKYFDNSLFKMIKDFTPARSSLASGVVIKQNLLERNKYPLPETTSSINDFSGSILMGTIDGGAGGSVNKYNSLDTNPYYLANGLSNNYGLTQSWSESIVTPYGLDNVVHSSQDEFYNGEYSGSEYVVENGELNEANPYKTFFSVPLLYDVAVYDSINVSAGDFLSTFAVFPGDINIWYYEGVPPGGDLPPIGIPFGPTYAIMSFLDKNSVNSRVEILNMSEFTLIVPGTTVPRTFKVINAFALGSTAILTLLPDGGTVTNGASSLNVLVTIDPYIPGVFANSDYNALINNSELNRLSQFAQQVNYNTAQTIPVNFQQIISGTAFPAAIQDSNYTSYQYSGIRYWGSKNTTDDFNSALTLTASIVQTYQNDNIGITTLGYPSVNNFDTGIYEFAWGGGTYPEIAGGGAVKLSQILNVDSTSSVGIISPLTDYFASVVAQDLVPNSLPQFTQYTTTANIPNTARVMTTDFGVPTISSYIFPSGSSASIGFSGSITANNAAVTFANSASLVTTNSSGFYIPGSGVSREEMLLTISSSLNEGDRWFMSYYYNMGSPVSGTLLPVNTGYTSSIFSGGFTSPVTVNGVYEIVSVGVASANSFNINPLPRTGRTFGVDAGILIWKAITDGTFVLFNGATLSGVGKGNLITSTASPTIKNNLTYITQEYGTNPKNQ